MFVCGNKTRTATPELQGKPIWRLAVSFQHHSEVSLASDGHAVIKSPRRGTPEMIVYNVDCLLGNDREVCNGCCVYVCLLVFGRQI